MIEIPGQALRSWQQNKTYRQGNKSYPRQAYLLHMLGNTWHNNGCTHKANDGWCDYNCHICRGMMQHLLQKSACKFTNQQHNITNDREMVDDKIEKAYSPDKSPPPKYTTTYLTHHIPSPDLL